MRSSSRLKGISPLKKQDKKGTNSDSKSSDPTKRPRTVHIDVYCTGTELESEEESFSSSSSENKTTSSPQTVFESGQFRITHKRAQDEDLPFRLRDDLKIEEGVREESVKEQHKEEGDDDDDDEDEISTAYPSQMSSFSHFGSSLSSVPPSWSSYSMSSCAIPDNDYDSIANTSWKDTTVSDFGSAFQSRSSLALTESLDFVPRKLSEIQQKNSIEEEGRERCDLGKFGHHVKLKRQNKVEERGSFEDSGGFENRAKDSENLENQVKDHGRFINQFQDPGSFKDRDKFQDPNDGIQDVNKNRSKTSLQGSDSFEYANSEDRLRIKMMENKWNAKNRAWKSPQIERKHMMQQRKLKEYLNKKLGELPKIDTKESESDDSDSSEKGWTFIKDDESKKLGRVFTVRKVSKEESDDEKNDEDCKNKNDGSVGNRSEKSFESKEKFFGPQMKYFGSDKPFCSNEKSVTNKEKSFGHNEKSLNCSGKSFGPDKFTPSNKKLSDSNKKPFVEKIACFFEKPPTKDITRPKIKYCESSKADSGSLSDSSPTTSTCKSSSTLALKQRLSLDPRLRAPFTIVPGIYTEQRRVAKRFGDIVNVFRKPGHHVGPAKNPDCLCDHCQSFYSNLGYRNRARSVGDDPYHSYFNWKDLKSNQSSQSVATDKSYTEY